MRRSNDECKYVYVRASSANQRALPENQILTSAILRHLVRMPLAHTQPQQFVRSVRHALRYVCVCVHVDLNLLEEMKNEIEMESVCTSAAAAHQHQHEHACGEDANVYLCVSVCVSTLFYLNACRAHSSERIPARVQIADASSSSSASAGAASRFSRSVCERELRLRLPLYAYTCTYM